MSDTMLSLTPEDQSGDCFNFKASTLAYNDFTRVVEYRWESQPTHAKLQKKGEAMTTPYRADQFSGVKNDKITLTGLLYPLHVDKGLTRIDRLRALAGKGCPFTLVMSEGRSAKSLGKYTITGINEEQSIFTKSVVKETSSITDHITDQFKESSVVPAKVEFQVTLSAYRNCSASSNTGQEFPAP